MWKQWKCIEKEPKSLLEYHNTSNHTKVMTKVKCHLNCNLADINISSRFSDICLTDFATLGDGQWLSDEIIMAFPSQSLQHLNNQISKDLLFWIADMDLH